MIDAVNKIPNLTPENIAILQKLLTDINNQSTGVLYGTTAPTTMDYGKTTIVDDGTAAGQKVVFKSGNGNLITLNSVLTITDQAAGDLLYYSGSAWIRLAKGTASYVLKMKADGTIPEWGALATSTTYDSGWFACTSGGTYSLTHGLGTTKAIFKLYFSTDSGGANAEEATVDFASESSTETGGYIQQIGTTTCVVQAGANGVQRQLNADGNATGKTDGYYRVLGIAI